MASKVKGHKGKVITEMEDLAIMAWAEEVGLGVNVNGNIDLVRDQLATGTDEALNVLASGWFNGVNGKGITPRTPEAIWGRWTRHRPRFKRTWEKLWKGEWDGEKDERVVVEEVAEVDVRKAAMEREIRKIEDAISPTESQMSWRISGMRKRYLTSMMRFPSQTGWLRVGMEAGASINIRQRPSILCLRTRLKGSGLLQRPTGPLLILRILWRLWRNS